MAVGGVIPFVFPGLDRIQCAFTTRLAGNLSLHPSNGAQADAAPAARRDVLARLGIDSWTELNQVHGDTMLVEPATTSLDATGDQDADGHMTARPGHALCVKTGDCQPILLAHPAGFVAAMHAGWRGNTLHFPKTGVAAFCQQYGLDPADVRAVRGPSLGYARFINFDREWPSEFRPWYDAATQCVDLWRLTRDQLLAAGLRPGTIYGLDLCTYSLPQLFFSYRRGEPGRQVGLIWTV